MDTSGTALQSTGVSVAQSTDRREALQALLAFSTLHDQIRRRRAEEARRYAKGLGIADNSWEYEQFVLDEVLHLVAERAQTVTGADGIAIALAEDDEIISGPRLERWPPIVACVSIRGQDFPEPAFAPDESFAATIRKKIPASTWKPAADWARDRWSRFHCWGNKAWLDYWRRFRPSRLDSTIAMSAA